MNNLNQPTGPHEVIRALRTLMPRRPLLTHEAELVAERQAQRLATLLDLTGPIIDLEPIAGLPRLDVRIRAGLPVSGFSEWSRGRWVVAINGDDHPTRQRFTLAHELKHILDNPFIDVLYPAARGKTSEQRGEEICDHFAACLLMPRPAVKMAWGQRHQRVRDLAAHFGVSQAAMGVRLQALRLTPATKRCGYRPDAHYERIGIPPSFSLRSAQPSGVWT